MLEDELDSDAHVALAAIETVKMESVTFDMAVADALELEYGNELFTLCAKWAINELELEPNPDKAKILQISLDYQVLSSQTAFLAIERTTSAA